MIGSFYKKLLVISTWLAIGLLIGKTVYTGQQAFHEVYYFGILDGKASLLTLLIVLCEIGFVLFLWKNRNCRSPWLITSLLFICFALISLFEGLAGVYSCDSFAVAQVRPYYLAALDAVMAVISFSCFLLLKKSEARIRWVKAYPLTVFLLIFFQTILAFLFTKESSIATDLFKQTNLVATFVPKPARSKGNYMSGDLLLTSKRGKKLRILGYEPRNGTWFFKKLPLPHTLENSEVSRFPIWVKVPEKGAIGIVTVHFYLEDNGLLVFPVTFRVANN